MKATLKKIEMNIVGMHKGLRGNMSSIWGDVSELSGDVSGLRGDVDSCELTDDDRIKGVDIAELVGE